MKLTLYFEDDTTAARCAGYTWALNQPDNSEYDVRAIQSAYRAFCAMLDSAEARDDEWDEWHMEMHDAFEDGISDARRVLFVRQLLSANEAAERANVDPSYIRAEIKAGRLPARKVGARNWIIQARDFRTWLANPRRGSRSKS